MSDHLATPGTPPDAAEAKPVFVDDPRQPDKVAPFREPLEEMAQIGPDGQLITHLETDKLDASDIDPETLLLKDGVDKVAPVTPGARTEQDIKAPEKKSRRGLFAAVGAGVAGAIAVAALLIPHGSNEPKEPVRPPESSAPAEPGQPTETNEAPGATAESLVGVPTAEGENLNVAPTAEIEKDALKPVTVAEYATPEAALARFTYLENVMRMGADLDTTGAIFETSESQQYRDELRNVMYVPEVSEASEAAQKLRLAISVSLWFTNGSGHIEGKEPTYHVSRTVNNVVENPDGTWTLDVTEHPDTNLTQIDPTLEEKVPDILGDQVGQVVLSQKDKIWRIVSITLSDA